MAKLWAQRRNGERVCLQVDRSMLAQLAEHRWYVTKQHYAYRIATVDGRRQHIMLHHEVWGGAPDAEHVIDHRNRDRLDCRRSNLRMIRRSPSQWNQGKRRHNTSGYKGVRRSAGSYRAEIQAHGRRYNLGNYPSPELAAVAYDAAARVLHGEYAVLNFPKGVRPAPEPAPFRIPSSGPQPARMAGCAFGA